MMIFASLDLGEHSHAPLQIFGSKDRLFAICDAPDCSRSVTRELIAVRPLSVLSDGAEQRRAL